ncbi:NADH dehydrogenase-like protein SAV0941 [Shimwellia blattae]|nr:NADH dehydrogenase-like protein SAV0941 [Shimwellia blattae]
MKNSVLIIGSGFAGMWSAVSAARLAYLNGRDDVEITVLAPRPELGIRPRFYEANVSTLAAPLGPLFSALGIRFIAGAAEHIDTHQQQVTYREPGGATATLGYQRLILATGSRLRREGVAGIARYGFDIDNQESAAQLERHLSGLADQPESVARNTVVVCGGGFTGIELACELPARLHQLLGGGTQIKVIVVDRGQTIASRYSAQMRETIVQASAELGVEWRLNSQVASVDAQGVTLADGSRIAAHTVVWTAGVQASDLSGQISAPGMPGSGWW